MSDRLDEIRKRMQSAKDSSLRGRLKGYWPATMVYVGDVLWLLDEVDRLRSERQRMDPESA